MPVEIERKFLVTNNDWRNNAEGLTFCQGYLSRNPNCIVRVRTEGEKAFMTIKGPIQGLRRSEFEYSIPKEEAVAMLELCETPHIHKTRYRITYDNHVWEIDEFHGENEGLIIAEIELDDEQETFTLPSWVGKEVTEDRRYANSNLAIHPYKKGNWEIGVSHEWR